MQLSAVECTWVNLATAYNPNPGAGCARPSDFYIHPPTLERGSKRVCKRAGLGAASLSHVTPLRNNIMYSGEELPCFNCAIKSTSRSMILRYIFLYKYKFQIIFNARNVTEHLLSRYTETFFSQKICFR